MTDGGTDTVDAWCVNNGDCGNDSANINFNTTGVVPAGEYSISTSCGFDIVGNASFAYNDGVGCGVGTYNNSGTTTVNVGISFSDGMSACCSGGATSTADIGNVTLTVTWYNPVSVTMAPTSFTVTAGMACCDLRAVLNAGVDSPVSTLVTWTLNPSGVGYLFAMTMYGQLRLFYIPPALVDANTAVIATATSVADPSKSASATITILPIPTVTVGVSPGSTTLRQGAAQQFSASVSNRINQGVTWTVSPSGAGSINSSGVYTASGYVSTAQTVTVTAASVLNAGWYGTATITVLPPAAVPVSVSPNAGTGHSQTFSLLYSDEYGAADLTSLYLLALSENSTEHSFYAAFLTC